MTTGDQMAAAAAAGRDAFWATVAAHFPHIETGDLNPLATLAFEQATDAVVEVWVMNNEPINEGG